MSEVLLPGLLSSQKLSDPIVYRGTSLIRNTPLLGPYSRTIPVVIWWSWGGGLFLMSEVPLHVFPHIRGGA